ncbi:hypothetical protein PLICRDRAFT_51760 [Plicaturopsis crispa FD-325 SS-3]|nr:hypothetical protein PLICRDRAFT_51760 [Plicaturopsis crispa FD-325 SS-3]
MHDASPLAAHDPPSVLALAGTPEARLWSALLFVVRGNAPTPREAALAAALDVHVPVVFVGVGDGGRAATDGDGGGDVGGGSSRDGHGEEGQDNGNGGEHGEHAQDDGERGHAERAHAHVERELGYLEGLPTQDGVNGLDNHNELDEHEYDDDFAGSFPGSASSSFLSFPTSLASSMYAPRDPSPLSRASEALSTSLSHLPSQPSLLPPSQHGPWTASAHAGSMPLAHVAPPTAPSQAPPLTSAHAVLPVSAYAAFDVLPRSALRTQLPSPETLRARAAERFVAWRDGRLGECSAVGAGRGINGMGDGGRMDGFDDGREILRVDDGRPVRRIARPRANAWKHDWEAFLARQALLAPPRLHERQAFHTSTKPAHKHTETSRRTRAGSYHPTRPDSPPPSSSKPTFPSRRSDTRMRGPLTDPLHLPSLLRLLLRACAASGKDAFAAPGQYAFAAPGRHAHGSFGSTLAPSYASTSTNSVMWLSFGLGLGLGLGVLLRGWM